MKRKTELVSRKRHILKTLTWRVVGTLDTMFLGWIITGNPIIGLKIGALELFTKMIPMYIFGSNEYVY